MIAFTRRRMLARLSCALLPAWTGTRAMAGAVPGAQEMLRVATMDLPPYGWVDEKGAKQGVEYELAEQLAIRSGFRYTNEIMPFARMLQALKEGKVDLLSSQAHQQALDAGEQLAVIHTNNVLVATKKDAGIKTLEDLRGKTFVYHRAASYKQLEGVPGHIERVNSYEQALNMLHSRQGVHAAVFSQPAYFYFMQKEGLKPEQFGPMLYLERNKEQWMFVRRGMPDPVKAKLKEVIDRMRNEGVYESILRKYGTPVA